jgi:DNA invertase Pin-like site-specific DNA recombinase
VDEFTDAGASGSNLSRPALTEALEMLKAGKADVLVVAKLDRVSRSVVDFARLTELAKRQGWALVALDLDLDTSTPMGELVAGIYIGVGQMERRLIGQRTSAAMQAGKAQGRRYGRPVTMAQSTREFIAQAHESGNSLRQIVALLDAAGIPTARGGQWTAATVRRVLQSLALDAQSVPA